MDKPLLCRAAARAAFREAGNRKAVLKAIEKETGVPVTLVTQDDEAVIGFLAASSSRQESKILIAPLDLAVWDIGGGSTQITVLNPGAPIRSRERYLISKQSLASESFKRYLIEKIQKKSSATKSPNPISQADADEALKYVRSKAADLEPEILKRIQSPTTQVVGIGAVHYESVAGQTKSVEDTPYTAAQVSDALKKGIGLTDENLGGSYADTQVSNLILVLGFMQQLKIKEVKALDVNLTDGILTASNFWTENQP